VYACPVDEFGLCGSSIFVLSPDADTLTGCATACLDAGAPFMSFCESCLVGEGCICFTQLGGTYPSTTQQGYALGVPRTPAEGECDRRLEAEQGSA